MTLRYFVLKGEAPLRKPFKKKGGLGKGPMKKRPLGRGLFKVQNGSKPNI